MSCTDTMILVRGTTPTHTYEFDTSIANANIQIVYSQGDVDILTLDAEDLRIADDGLSAQYMLSQTETNLFSKGIAYAQARVLKANGVAVASDIISFAVDDVLDDSILS